MKKAPSGTTRGVFVINKEAKIEAAAPGVISHHHTYQLLGANARCFQGPMATVEVVRKLVGAADDKDLGHLAKDEKEGKETEEPGAKAQDGEHHEGSDENDDKAEVAAEVADTAEKLDGKAQA